MLEIDRGKEGKVHKGLYIPSVLALQAEPGLRTIENTRRVQGVQMRRISLLLSLALVARTQGVGADDYCLRVLTDTVSFKGPILVQRLFQTSLTFNVEVTPDSTDGNAKWKVVLTEINGKWKVSTALSRGTPPKPTKAEARRNLLSFNKLLHNGLLRYPLLVTERNGGTQYSTLPLTPGGFLWTTVHDDGRVSVVRGE